LSLRSRLTLFFVLAVVVPLLALTLSVTIDRPPGGGLDRRLPAMLAMLAAAFCVVATLLGALLARLVSQPLHELAEQARAIARGDFANPPSAVRSTGEIGELARAFDSMRVDLGAYVAAVRGSRDELARAMFRLGQTLSSTHDLPRLLAVVLEAAVRSRQGVAGSVLLLSVDRASLVRQATFGLPAGELAARVPVGHGIAGTVAASGRPVVVSAAADRDGSRTAAPRPRRRPLRCRRPAPRGHRPSRPPPPRSASPWWPRGGCSACSASTSGRPARRSPSRTPPCWPTSPCRRRSRSRTCSSTRRPSACR